ncbi:hypothetical protein LRD18_12520, partial [Halorhodospira halochloris]|uniref:hypothetical protein n=1 Tax=Halorhodospira halochloris TaxID=1052 RepID=UPI001EE85A87
NAVDELEAASAIWPTDEELDEDARSELEARLGESYRPERPESFSERRERDEWDLPDDDEPGDDDDPPEGFEGVDEMLPVGDGEVDFTAADDSTVFGFDVEQAQETDALTQINFTNFDEEFELVLNLPDAYDGESELTLLELAGADLGDGQEVYVEPHGGFGENKLVTNWGQDGTDEGNIITLELQGTTNPEDIGVEVI